MRSSSLLRTLFIVPLLGTVLALTGCVTVPETGRKQLMLVSESTVAAQGIRAFQQLKKEEKVSTDPVANARLQRIGRRIAGAVGRDLPNADWEFVVFDSKELNAFALPGGKVGFYTGLMNLAASDDEIAVVMGHEVAHVTSRHGAERMSQQLLVAAGGVALGVATRNDKNFEGYMLAYGLGTTVGLILPYSRSHETEADVVGLAFAARAGYDPRAGASFWEKMAAKEKGRGVPAWLSTHPSSRERIIKLRELAGPLMPVYEEARLRFEGGVPPALARPATPAAAPNAPSGPIRPARKGDPIPGM